jgi:hypothetical protein
MFEFPQSYPFGHYHVLTVSTAYHASISSFRLEFTISIIGSSGDVISSHRMSISNIDEFDSFLCVYLDAVDLDARMYRRSGDRLDLDAGSASCLNN